LLLVVAAASFGLLQTSPGTRGSDALPRRAGAHLSIVDLKPLTGLFGQPMAGELSKKPPLNEAMPLH
jgi:hypothetical protein